jgi:hypothetical protein
LQLGFSPEVRADSARSGWELGVISAIPQHQLSPPKWMQNRAQGMIKYTTSDSVGLVNNHLNKLENKTTTPNNEDEAEINKNEQDNSISS